MSDTPNLPNIPFVHNIHIPVVIDDINTHAALAWKLGLDRAPTGGELAIWLTGQLRHVLSAVTSEYYDHVAERNEEVRRERAQATILANVEAMKRQRKGGK